MKTSKKILITIGISLTIFPILIFFLQGREFKKNPRLLYKRGEVYYSLEDLQNFKHLRIIGNDSTLSKHIRFSYADSCFSLNKKDKFPKEFSIDYQKDTLIISLNKTNGSYWKDAIEQSESLPRLHLFAPALETVSLHKIGLIINTVSEHRKQASTEFNLNQSELIMQTSYTNTNGLDATKLNLEDMPYKSLKIKGIDCFFDLGDVGGDALNLSLQGKSTLKISSVNFGSLSGVISKETQLEIPKEYAEKLTIK